MIENLRENQNPYVGFSMKNKFERGEIVRKFALFFHFFDILPPLKGTREGVNSAG